MRVDKTTVYRLEALKPVHRRFGHKDEFYRYDIVAADGQSRGITVQVYNIPPGKANYPYHYHETNDEVFYVISGEGLLATEEGEETVTAGDIIVCPPTPQGAHRITNASTTENLIYIEFDAVAFPEVAHYPKADAIGVLFADMRRNLFFKTNASISYSDDVETED